MTVWLDNHPAVVIAGLVALCLWILIIVLVLCAMAWAELEDRQQRRQVPPPYLTALEEIRKLPTAPRPAR